MKKMAPLGSAASSLVLTMMRRCLFIFLSGLMDLPLGELSRASSIAVRGVVLRPSSPSSKNRDDYSTPERESSDLDCSPRAKSASLAKSKKCDTPFTFTAEDLARIERMLSRADMLLSRADMYDPPPSSSSNETSSARPPVIQGQCQHSSKTRKKTCSEEHVEPRFQEPMDEVISKLRRLEVQAAAAREHLKNDARLAYATSLIRYHGSGVRRWRNVVWCVMAIVGTTYNIIVTGPKVLDLMKFSGILAEGFSEMDHVDHAFSDEMIGSTESELLDGHGASEKMLLASEKSCSDCSELPYLEKMFTFPSTSTSNRHLGGQNLGGGDQEPTQCLVWDDDEAGQEQERCISLYKCLREHCTTDSAMEEDQEMEEKEDVAS
ncbi:unnamed protein product [Amoebophrya sp. A25]|nr:unnamed protein product [Amoebophrya sp. A25]|eukprot:GSA25T00017159001.1